MSIEQAKVGEVAAQQCLQPGLTLVQRRLDSRSCPSTLSPFSCSPSYSSRAYLSAVAVRRRCALFTTHFFWVDG